MVLVVRCLGYFPYPRTVGSDGFRRHYDATRGVCEKDTCRRNWDGRGEQQQDVVDGMTLLHQ